MYSKKTMTDKMAVKERMLEEHTIVTYTKCYTSFSLLFPCNQSCVNNNVHATIRMYQPTSQEYPHPFVHVIHIKLLRRANNHALN